MAGRGRGRGSDRFDIEAVELVIAGRTYKLANISSTGVLVRDYPNAPKRGTALEMVVRLPVMGSMTPMEFAGMVVRDDGQGNVAINYAPPSRTWTKLLETLKIKESGAD